jgi:hypothetical protein
MAGEKNAFSFSSEAVNPEDLHAVAIIVTPESTPVFTAMGDGWEVTNAYHEWEIDALSDPKVNAVQEGGSVTVDDHALPIRLGNRTQIMERGYFITTTQEAIAKKTGTKTTIGQRMLQAVKEIKRDANKAVIENSAVVAHAASTAGKFGGLPYWFDQTNSTFGSLVNYVDASSSALSEDHVIDALQKIWEDHDADNLVGFVSGKSKKAIDGFTGGAIRNKTTDNKKAGSVTDIYETSFGMVTFTKDRQMVDTAVYIIDPEYYKKGFLQELQNVNVTDSSNFTKHRKEKLVTWEMTMECRHPSAGCAIKNLV